MDLQLQDDVVVVIGGARGLGLAIGRGFAEEGARVSLVDRDEAVREAAAGLPGGRGVGHVADMTDAGAMERCAQAICDAQGRIDHVVLAAAAGSGKFGFPFTNLAPGDWERVLRVTLQGPVNATHAFVRHVMASGRGTFVFIGSVAGQIGSQTDPPYSSAKAGLINFAQCVAKDLAAHGARANVICPGMVKTALNESVYRAWADQERGRGMKEVPDYETWAAEKIRKLIPLGRWQEPEDIAAMAVFLASRRAKNITGQTINIDGGWVMHA
jgi:NAD(P)-dependent dehydrogenase (short-subunit alcohol dehydrogenase family)